MKNKDNLSTEELDFVEEILESMTFKKFVEFITGMPFEVVYKDYIDKEVSEDEQGNLE